MEDRRALPLLSCILALFVLRAALAVAIVPPWQGPDEPTHFVLAQVLAMPSVNIDTETVTRQVQGEVIESMARHRWWEPYGGSAPYPLPTRFPQISRLGTGTYAQPLYYGLAAAVLRVTQPGNVERAYWHLRVLAVALGVGTLALGWAGTRLLFGTSVATGATAIAALQPQFLLTAISVNADGLLNLLGAFMWWQVARVFRGHRRDLSVMLLIVATGAAALTKRSGIPVAVVAAAVAAAVCLLPGQLSRVSRIVFRRSLIAALTLAGAVILTATLPVFEQPWADMTRLWTNAFNIRRPLDASLVPAALVYGRLSIDYVWLMAGWLRFPAPEAWLGVATVLTIVGFGGAAALLISPREIRRPLVIAWLFVVVQTASVIGWGFLTLSSPQGRYMFSVIAPATALLWLGLTHASPARVKPYAAPALIAILALLDVTGFSTVLIPAYLPWG